MTSGQNNSTKAASHPMTLAVRNGDLHLLLESPGVYPKQNVDPFSRFRIAERRDDNRPAHGYLIQKHTKKQTQTCKWELCFTSVHMQQWHPAIALRRYFFNDFSCVTLAYGRTWMYKPVTMCWHTILRIRCIYTALNEWRASPVCLSVYVLTTWQSRQMQWTALASTRVQPEAANVM